jgi:hypothetical protein
MTSSLKVKVFNTEASPAGEKQAMPPNTVTFVRVMYDTIVSTLKPFILLIIIFYKDTEIGKIRRTKKYLISMFVFPLVFLDDAS